MDRKVYVSFNAMAWKGHAASLKLIINDGEPIIVEPLGNTDSYTFSPFNIAVPAVALASGTVTVRFEGAKANSGCFFIDDLLVYCSNEVFEPVLSVKPSSLTLQAASEGGSVSGNVTVSGEFLTSDVAVACDNANFTASSLSLPFASVLAGAPLMITYSGSLAFDTAVVSFTSGSAAATLKVYVTSSSGISSTINVLPAAIYPNPSPDGRFTVSTANGTRYEVVDLRGCVVDCGTVGSGFAGSSFAGSGSKHLRIHNTGVYLLRLIDSSGRIATHRIVVK
jgi:hypothetical protein